MTICAAVATTVLSTRYGSAQQRNNKLHSSTRFDSIRFDIDWAK